MFTTDILWLSRIFSHIFNWPEFSVEKIWLRGLPMAQMSPIVGSAFERRGQCLTLATVCDVLASWTTLICIMRCQLTELCCSA